MKAKEDVLKEKKQNFKSIVDHLGKGGIVYCYKYDMHVIGVFDTILKKELYLGDIDTKKIYLVVDYRDIDDMEDYSLYRFDMVNNDYIEDVLEPIPTKTTEEKIGKQ